MNLSKEQTWVVEVCSHKLKAVVKAINNRSSDGGGLWRAKIENIFLDKVSYKIIIGIYGSYPFMESWLTADLKKLGIEI